jgi:hypothetical protein
VKQNGQKVNLTGYTPFMFIAPSNTHPSIVTSACAIVTATNGTFTATWTPAMLNTNGTWIYGVGITDADGDTTARQGVFVLTPDPFAQGAGAMTMTTNYATGTQLAAEVAARIAGDTALSNYVANATNAIQGANGTLTSGATTGGLLTGGTNAGAFVVGLTTQAVVDAVKHITNGLGAGGVQTWTAGAGVTNTGTAANPTGALNAASVASMSLADTAVQPAVMIASGAVWVAQSTNLSAQAAALVMFRLRSGQAAGLSLPDGLTS